MIPSVGEPRIEPQDGDYDDPQDEIRCLREANIALKSSLTLAVKRAEEAVKAEAEWAYCPECGSTNHERNSDFAMTHRQCMDCGQEWHTDIDYRAVVGENVAELKASAKSAEAQVEEMKAAMAAKDKELGAVRDKLMPLVQEHRRIEAWNAGQSARLAQGPCRCRSCAAFALLSPTPSTENK